jgi:guanidinoacetate N-methyltransferase
MALDDLTENSTNPTVASRLDIGFPDRHQWCDAAAAFTDHDLWIAGHPVMQDWEDGYMATLAEIIGKRGGRVLEVGYGLGISARYLLSYPAVAEHWIIECHPDVIEHAMVDLKDEISAGRVHLLTGFWEEVVETIADNHFDGILFDTYPLTTDEIHRNHFPFFPEAKRLLCDHGTFTYYSDEADGLPDSHITRLKDAGFTRIDWISVDVNPPLNCEYWQANSITAPIVRP